MNISIRNLGAKWLSVLTGPVLIAMALSMVTLGGCSTVADKIPDKKVEYRESGSAPELEMPPRLATPRGGQDLSIPPPRGTTTYSKYASKETPVGTDLRTVAVLPQPEGIKLEQDGNTRWLEVDENPDTLWPKIREFWMEQGMLLAVEDPRVGIMETDWAENRADIPQGPVRNLIGKVIDSIYSAATRDKYRTRLERGASPDVTDIFITHYGLKEVISQDDDGQGVSTTTWEARPSDPELAAEMLSRLMVYLGVQQEQADRIMAEAEGTVEQPKSRLVQTNTGQTLLQLNEGFSRGWRQVGQALDRVGFAVEDRDRSKGIYYVRYNDPLKGANKEGILSKLKFWGEDEPSSEDQYRIKVEAVDEGIEVGVLQESGEPDTSSTAKRILTLIHEQLQ